MSYDRRVPPLPPYQNTPSLRDGARKPPMNFGASIRIITGSAERAAQLSDICGQRLTTTALWQDYNNFERDILRTVDRLASLTDLSAVRSVEVARKLATSEAHYLKDFRVGEPGVHNPYSLLSAYIGHEVGKAISGELGIARPELADKANRREVRRHLASISIAECCTRPLMTLKTERDRALPQDGFDIEPRFILENDTATEILPDGSIRVSPLAVGLSRPFFE